MLWDYSLPKGRVIVSNGSQITLYDPDDRQALIAKQPREGGLPVAVSFLIGRGKLREMFRIALHEDRRGKNGEVVLKCTPIQPEPNLAEVYLTLKMGDPVFVVGTKIIDSLGGENELRFSDLKINRPVAADRFEFKPPKGTPIVSMPTVKTNL
jgi:outer membrane lipoprotein carrier protein